MRFWWWSSEHSVVHTVPRVQSEFMQLSQPWNVLTHVNCCNKQIWKFQWLQNNKALFLPHQAIYVGVLGHQEAFYTVSQGPKWLLSVASFSLGWGKRWFRRHASAQEGHTSLLLIGEKQSHDSPRSKGCWEVGSLTRQPHPSDNSTPWKGSRNLWGAVSHLCHRRGNMRQVWARDQGVWFIVAKTTCHIHISFLPVSSRAQPGRSCPLWKLAMSKKTSVVGKRGQWFRSVWDLERMPLNPLLSKQLPPARRREVICLSALTLSPSDLQGFRHLPGKLESELGTDCPWTWPELTHSRSEWEEKAKADKQALRTLPSQPRVV